MAYERFETTSVQKYDAAARARGSPGRLPPARRADDLRDLGVHVEAAQLVATLGERDEDPVVVETPGERAIARLAGHGGELVEEIVHAAVFDVEDPGHLCVVELRGPAAGPVGHPASHLERLAVAAQRVLVEQSRHDLVERVEGRPDPLAREEPVEETLGEGREVPVAQSRLAGGEPFDRSSAARRQRGVPGPRRNESAGREVVPGEVAAQLVLRRLPASERRGGRGEARVQAEGMEEAIGVEAREVAAVDLGGVEERAGGEAHAALREGARANPILRRSGAAGAPDGSRRERRRGAGSQKTSSGPGRHRPRIIAVGYDDGDVFRHR